MRGSNLTPMLQNEILYFFWSPLQTAVPVWLDIGEREQWICVVDKEAPIMPQRFLGSKGFEDIPLSAAAGR